MLPSLSSLPIALSWATLIVFAPAGLALAQADGAAMAMVSPGPVLARSPGAAFTAASTAPEAALMNDLQSRMKEIQATPDPMQRQKRMDDFLKTLQQGMVRLGQPTAPNAAR